MTKEEFFDKLDSSSTWDLPVSMKRTNNLPIDLSSVFKDINDLNEYIASGISYPGQIVSVFNDENGIDVFVLGLNGSTSPIAPLTNGVKKFKNTYTALSNENLNVQHGLGTEDVVVSVINAVDKSVINVKTVIVDSNNVVLNFGQLDNSMNIKVVVIG